MTDPLDRVDRTHRVIAAVWRIESAKVIATLARLLNDVGLAEEFAQDALIAALDALPRDGVPENPGAWLTTSARRRALDHLRRQAVAARSHTEIGHALAEEERHGWLDAEVERDLAIDGTIDDDLLRLIFTACHPVLSREARVALTLRVLGGLTTDEIARAFLVPEATVAQRIVRAKRTLAEARVPFELPAREALADRLDSVLEVIYLIFNEGYSATAGDAWLRPALCDEALRLARVLAGLMPREPEVLGLQALLEIQASRAAARIDASGAPILLLEQNRARWDPLLIQRGLTALARAEAAKVPLGPYALQAAIAACHARARHADDTDWQRIVALYDALAEITQSPVVELNRAVAVAMAFGPAAGLELVDALVADGALASYHLLPSVRGDLLYKLGRLPEARAEFERAASMTRNRREQMLLAQRADECA